MQVNSSDRKYFLFSLLFLLLFVFAMPRFGHSWDTDYFINWGEHIFQGGLGNVYQSETDYLPFFHFFLYIYVSLQSSMEAIAANIHYFKLASLVLHLFTGYFIVKIQTRSGINEDTALRNALFYLLNLAVLYNTLIWNQVDIILTALVFVSVYAAIRQKILLSIVLLLLALNFKLHAIIFVPIVVLLVLPSLVGSLRTGRILIYLVIPALFQVFILLPFLLAGTAHKIPGIVTASVDKYPMVSIFAYNIWHLLLSGDLHLMPDSTLFMGLSYKNWGLIMFFSTSALALFPLLKNCYRQLRDKQQQFPIVHILLVSALIPLLFFYCNTQMHERYSHPALAFLVIFGIMRRSPVPAVLASVAYLLNLEHALRYLELASYNTLIFDPLFISLLYLSCILLLFYYLYKNDIALKAAVSPGQGPNGQQ